MISLDSGDKIRGDASVATVVDFIISGLDANAIKQLADGQLASGIGDLYTADSADVVTSIILVNTDSSARVVNLYVLPSGGGSARRIIPKNTSLGIGYCLITDGKQISVYDASGNLQQTVTIVAHALGGSSHDADTLSNLNTKVSDATLVDTDDIILKSLLTTQDDIIVRGASDPARLNIAASRIVAKLAAGNLKGCTVAEILTLIGVASGADVTGSNPPQAHKDLHDPEDGSDLLDTAAPVQVGSANDIGSSHSLARADHVHQREHAIYVDASAVSAVEAAGLGLASGKNIKVIQALTSDHTWSGLTAVMTAGTALTIGQAVYVGGDSKMEKALATGAATMPAIALATGSISENASGEFLMQGFFRDDTWTWTPGGLLYVSKDTAGALTQTLPAATGEQVQVVGVAITADIIHFNPSYELVEIR